MNEIWKDVEGFEGYYQVSNHGRVKSLKRMAACRGGAFRTIRERILKQGTANKRGHLNVMLSREGTHKNQWVHRLVLKTFTNECPKGYQCCHNDGNPMNNHIENLRWGSKEENAADKILHGTVPSGAKHPNSKLTEAQVINIRTLYSNGGYTFETLGQYYGVHLGTIHSIIHRKTWKHI